MLFDEPMSEKCRWLVAEIVRLFLPWGVDVQAEWQPNPFNPRNRVLHVLLNKKIERLAYYTDVANLREIEHIEASRFGLAWAMGEVEIEQHRALEVVIERLFTDFFLGFHRETARPFPGDRELKVTRRPVAEEPSEMWAARSRGGPGDPR
jgi:hypothetical protein